MILNNRDRESEFAAICSDTLGWVIPGSDLERDGLVVVVLGALHPKGAQEFWVLTLGDGPARGVRIV